MKIVIFGVSGGVGHEVMLQAVKVGHGVIGVTRSLKSSNDSTANPQLVTGSVTDSAFVAKVCHGADIVISAVGTMQYKQPVTLYSAGTQALIVGMQQANVHRIIVLSAGGATIEPNDTWPFRLIFKPILQHVFHYLYADMLQMERLLENSDLDWTILRLSYLTGKPKTTKYRTQVEGAVSFGFSIGRADVAHYIVEHLNDETTFRHPIGIAY